MGRSALICPKWEYMGRKVDNLDFTTEQTPLKTQQVCVFSVVFYSEAHTFRPDVGKCFMQTLRF